MKIYRNIFTILFLLAPVTCAGVLNGMQMPGNQPGERVVLFCDRNLYIAGEQILFSAFLQTGNEPGNTEQSRILYCELISPDGSKISGNKYLIENCKSSGYLYIPEDIITGTYWLRAYTRVMRNNGPYYYHYTIIKIVNPDRKEVQGLSEDNSLNESPVIELNPEYAGHSFDISADRSQYSLRDTLHISIGEIGKTEFPWTGLSLSVVPEFSVSAKRVKFSENRQSGGSGFWYPETRGLSVTGTLEDNSTGNPLPRTLVNLSVIGRGRDFMAMQTDSAGRFYFSLPDYSGRRDLFLCTENISTGDPKILVDNDFCTLPVHLASDIFTLTGEERETAYNMAVNKQLESYFRVDTITGAEIDQTEDQAFYGKPDDILYIEDYIQLPTLEEYFNELPTLVKVRKRKGVKYFKVLGPQSELDGFDPLILVDLVAIDDPSKVLSVSPANVSRIEVVTGLYVKGDQTYGGIVNIITKHGDFGGIDLPSSGIFINYGFLSGGGNSPKTYPPMPHTPDTRNTLYWNPLLLPEAGKTAKVSFTASDTPGRYLVILKGVNTKGETIMQTVAFEVIAQSTPQRDTKDF